MIGKKQEFSREDMKAFEPSEKLGLLASINPEGLPHITLITSMQANKPKELVIGQFVSGLSKQFIQKNNNIGFLVMTFDKMMWKGKARWTRMGNEGAEYERMNLIPMFRYNTYFGINTVHYFDLLEVSEASPLPMPKIISETLKTLIVKRSRRTYKNKRILKPFVEDMFNSLASLKFLSYIGDDGYPTIIPVIQSRTSDSTRLVFSGGVFSEELDSIPEGSNVAVFCMNFGIEDVLIRGTFKGLKRSMGIKLGEIDIEWVYNSMPPALGQIYPPVELKPCTNF